MKLRTQAAIHSKKIYDVLSGRHLPRILDVLNIQRTSLRRIC